MPRILYIHTQALRAESPHARRTFEMLTLMRRAGLDVDVLTLPRGDAWPKGLANHVYRTLPVPFARSLPPYGTGLRRRWATVVTALAAARLLLHKQYDAVHCADRAVRVGALLAWLFGVRLVFEWRTASGHDLTAWARARSKRSRRAVGLIITDHPCHPAGLRETGLLGRLAVIPPLPAPTIEPLPPPPARPKGASQLFRLTAFSLTPDLSDLTDFLEALPRLIERPNIRISIAGGSPAAAERLRKRCAETLPADAQPGIRPAIVSPAEFSTFVAPADLVFLPAANGPLPPPELLDAMAARRAILAVRCPAYEGLLNEANAMLIDSDARSLALGVLRHLRAPCLCVDHACAAAETIADERAIADATDDLRACYALALDQETP